MDARARDCPGLHGHRDLRDPSLDRTRVHRPAPELRISPRLAPRGGETIDHGRRRQTDLRKRERPLDLAGGESGARRGLSVRLRALAAPQSGSVALADAQAAGETGSTGEGVNRAAGPRAV